MANEEGRIFVFFEQDFSATIVAQSEQFKALRMTHFQLNSAFLAVFVHASCEVEERVILWQNLVHAFQPPPTLVCGDFNVITSPEEKLGGRPFKVSQAEDFIEFMDVASLVDVGSRFTWCNNRFGRARVWKTAFGQSALVGYEF